MDQEIKEVKKRELPEKVFLAAVYLFVAFLAIQAVNTFIAYEGLGKNAPREIVVSASGQAFVIPDVALMQLGVTTEGFDVGKITSDNTDKMNKIISEVKAAGVEEKDIKTTNYSLSPKYDYSRGAQIFKGYTLVQQITVKVRNFGKIGDILGKATASGANLIGSFQFTIEDENSVKQLARTDAIQKAKTQAESIAQQAGLKLGKLVNFYENGYSPVSGYYTTAKAMDSSGIGGGAATAEIQPGQQEVSISVSLVYQLD